MKKIISVLLIFSLVFCITACKDNETSKSLAQVGKDAVEGITELITDIVTKTTQAETQTDKLINQPVRNHCYENEENLVIDSPASFEFIKSPLVNCTADFGIRLFKEILNSQKNPIISPLSVIYAMSAVTLGANGKTLEQLENILNINVEVLASLNAYMSSQESFEDIAVANSVWINSARFAPESRYISNCKGYLNAEVFCEAFNGNTNDKINGWVSKSTDGAIKNMLAEEVSPEAMICLVNALLFDAQWEKKYTEYNVSKNEIFTTEDEKKQSVTMLYSSENSSKLFTLGKTTGIVKDYDNGYSFVAMLPNEGVGIAEAMNSFNGRDFTEKLTSLNSKKSSSVPCFVKLPKFSFECSFELVDTLRKMGITDAFCEKADFSKMGTSKDGYIYLSRVIHKTQIGLNENGTKAGAATVAEMKAGSARIEEIKELYFDRPFIYAIAEKETGLLLFFGAVTDLG